MRIGAAHQTYAQAEALLDTNVQRVMLVALFAVLFLGERPSSREWLGILMIGAGVLVLAAKR